MESDYLIRKKPMQALLIFSLPIILGNLFQQTYTMADSAIVGRFVSEQALAAVGASYSLTNIFICVAIGGGMGASVIVGRHFGAKQYREMKAAIYTACLAFLAVSVLLGGLGLLFSRQIMTALNTPEDVMGMAVQYLNIYFYGLPFLFMYNVLSSMFNALGRSRIPLYFLIFSSVFNVALDLILVIQFDLGVAGVAWATMIAQGISAVMSFGVLVRELRKFGCDKTEVFNSRELVEMTRIALPSILQQSTVSIGMMLVQSVVNSFGSEALAGFSAAMRIESICVVPMSGIGNAVSSYTAQNIGARQTRRVVEGFHAAIRMVIVCAAVICMVLELFHGSIISLFLGAEGTETALATGENYLIFMGWFFCLIGFKMSVDSVLRGSGDMKIFTIANLVNLSVRVIIAVTMAPRFGIAMVWYAVPVGWFLNWAISYSRYRTGKWKIIAEKAVRTDEMKFSKYDRSGDAQMSKKIREAVTFTGRVQGVGFRYKMYYLSQQYGVTGWVRNEYDGSVSAQVQGTEEQIDRVIQALSNDRYIEIDHAWRSRIPLDEEERGFRMLN
ncbi:MAG TPA: MATE family efflux transporter [Candidatus Blautia excrementipullorum]|nr:MATE family efflux transporter [Candidatus Blautia excrementipullorum]